MELIKVKKVTVKKWHNPAPDIDYYTKEKQIRFIVSMTEKEYDEYKDFLEHQRSKELKNYTKGLILND